MVDAHSKRKSINKDEVDDFTKQLLLEAYRQAWHYDEHLTSINWLIASIFVAGIFGALGLVFSQEPSKQLVPHSVSVIAAIGIFVIFMWFLFVRRNRALSFVARKPAFRIERMLFTVLESLGPLEAAEKASERPKGHTIVQLFVVGLIWLLLMVIAQDWTGIGVYTGVIWASLLFGGVIIALAVRLLSPKETD
jgi:hypothetical protein